VAALVAIAGCRSILALDNNDNGTPDGDASSDSPTSMSTDGDGSVIAKSDSGQSQGGKDSGSGNPTDASTIDQWTPDANRNVDREWAAWTLPPNSPLTANYSVTADTVLDHTTFLVWQRYDDGVLRQWKDAKDYCDTLTLGGQTDWRLPTRIELWSIVDFGKHAPAINTVAFLDASTQSYYWALTLDAQNSVVNPTYKAWVVSFDEGISGPIDSTMYTELTRCVRGG
jgi:hypothetical protein